MAPRRIVPFRIPFFRIFYSTTYTTLYIVELCLLAITPISIIWTAVQNKAYQYVVMVGGVYVLTVSLAVFIYSSRLYTNRSVLAGVGKAYIPIEKGELGHHIRKMIVRQLERSCVVAWESRPRDLEGEILEAEKQGLLASEEVIHHYTVGRIIPVDPETPPWGTIEHEGWSSPSHRDDHASPHVQFADVVAELPNLVEARAVSLAPPDPAMTPTRDGQPVMADPTVVELLRRPENMGMREYLTQLGYLGLIQPPALAQTFLSQYERARFCGRPISEMEFNDLMKTFSLLLSGMSHLDPEIIRQIRAQSGGPDGEPPSSSDSTSSIAPPTTARSFQYHTPSPAPPRSPGSSLLSPVTAREAVSRNTTPRLTEQHTPSQESLSSIVHTSLREEGYGLYAGEASDRESTQLDSASQVSLPSDAGSVVRYSARLNSEDG
ncbi:Sucrase ferredoxin domain-containing protein [Teratosphaeria destructans]|uniref:Defect at low temperature protein 1 n=1 Tax=Teratosphaeria destructans TaxID=418781 RepID=A0A9W7SLW5_9PEZI|nr:Sucrase ferredoxin domain-containing protein [Teratosphaeria destructans]